MRLRNSGIVSPFEQLRNEMDRLLGYTYRPAAGVAVGAESFPLLNMWEQDDAVYVEAELPGVKNEDMEITVVGSELTLSGKRDETEEAEAVYHRRERGAGTFLRVLHLPVEVEAAKVNAVLANGVLLITLPKAEAAKPRKIQVSAG